MRFSTTLTVLVVIATLLSPSKTRSGLLYTPSTMSLEPDLNRPTATSEPGSDTSPALPTVTMTEPSERLFSNLPLNTNHHRNHGAGSSTSEPATSVMTNQLGNSNANSHAPSILSPPKMWKEHLPSYFQLLDSWFVRHQIVDELVKFDLLISAMSDHQQCNFGSDIGYCASTSNPYSAVKNKILQPSTNYKGRYQWVVDIQDCSILQNKRPSVFMQRLQSLAKYSWRTDTSVQDAIIAQFFSNLPSSVVSIIILTNNLNDLDNIVRLADCALDKSVSQCRPTNDFESFKNVITAQMQELCTHVSNLRVQQPVQPSQHIPASRPTYRVTAPTPQLGPPPNKSHNTPQSFTHPFSTQHKHTSQPPSGQDYNERGWCWYHFTYFEKARRCLPGCTFKQQARPFHFIRTPMHNDEAMCLVKGLPQVRDSVSGSLTILDSGACHSFFPASPQDKLNPPNDCLTKYSSASNDPVPYYGSVTRDVDIGFGPMSWTFQLSDVKQIYIGCDFLGQYEITMRRLLQATDLNANCVLTHYPTNHEVYASDFVRAVPQTAVGLANQSAQYADLFSEFPSVTQDLDFTTPPKHDIRHTIINTGLPVATKARRRSPEMSKKIKQEIEAQLKTGLLEPSDSEWASPLHVVNKADGSIRLVGDYRLLDNQIKPDKYNLPHIQDFTNSIQNAKIFSTIDMKSAFNQIPMHVDHKHKTNIITPWGLFAFTAMPFGLKTSAQQWQRLMDVALRGLNNHFCYVDDIIIFSESEEAHLQHLRQLFARFATFGLKVNPKKCHFGKSEVKFLGFLVSRYGCTPLPDRVEAIQKLPAPTTAKQLRSFIGTLQYYRRVIPNAAALLAPLDKLLQGKKKFSGIVFTGEAEKAYDAAKLALVNSVMIAHPRDNARTALVTDASGTAIGAVLQQCIDNVWRPLGYFSKRLTLAQQKYATFDRELLGAFLAVQHFGYFLQGRKFTLFVDHLPLVHAMHADTPRQNARQARHLALISKYTTDI